MRFPRLSCWLALGASLWLVACTAPTQQPPQVASIPLQPEAASGWVAKPGWATHTYAVAAANPLATQAGQQMLQQGGSAVDAAIAVQMVLTLVEPQSSGLGGGAFLLHFDGQRTRAYDGRETAPATATPALFLAPDGKPMPMKQAIVGGRSVGVPGALRMLALAHRQHGRLPWAQLFEPAIALAREGFAVSPRMATLLAQESDLKRDGAAAAYFYDAHGKAWPAGHILRNPELAAVLTDIAQRGADALMTGAVAQAMVHAVQHHPSNPGGLSLSDLALYQPLEREPLCFDYAVLQRAYHLCGMPPPSSGTLAIGQILGLLQQTPAAHLPLDHGLPQPDWLHFYAEASRLAFADRAQYVGDPAFVAAPAGRWDSLLQPSYLAQRARLINSAPNAPAMPSAPAGQPDRTVALSWARMPEQPEYGTSHISVVDAYGHALAMTTTIEAAWGSRILVNRGVGLSGGFLLNNELTDFALQPADASGKPVANRVEAGKRPRSSMSPILVFDQSNGQLVASAGSPGGALIIHFTAKTLYGLLNWNLNAQEAIDLPNFGTVGGPLLLEAGRFPAATVQALQARGHTVNPSAMPSGLQAIQRVPRGGLFGGADPRREGIVLGD